MILPSFIQKQKLLPIGYSMNDNRFFWSVPFGHFIRHTMEHSHTYVPSTIVTLAKSGAMVTLLGSSGSKRVRMARKYSLLSAIPSLMTGTSISCDITVSLKTSWRSTAVKSNGPIKMVSKKIKISIVWVQFLHIYWWQFHFE